MINYKPLVSIIVPVYNNENYLDKCLTSLIQQTYNNIEIILVNDGSKDRSEDICLRYASLDDRVHYFYQANSGVSEARNKGLYNARGDYLLFVDSDDWLTDNAVDEFIRIALEEGADVTILRSYTVLKQGTFFEPRVYLESLTHNEIVELLLLDSIGNHVIVKLFHREIWEKLRFPKGIVYEDMYVMAEIVLKAKKIVCREIPIYFYNRMNENSLTSKKNDFNSFHRYSKFLAYSAHENAGVLLSNDKIISWSVKKALHEIAKAFVIDGGAGLLNNEYRNSMKNYIKNHEEFICHLGVKDKVLLWSIDGKGIICKLYGKIKALIVSVK